MHGGRLGLGPGMAARADGAGAGARPELARLSVAVSMVPRAWADAGVQAARRAGFAQGQTFNHSPHEAGTSAGTIEAESRAGHAPPALNAEQLQLL